MTRKNYRGKTTGPGHQPNARMTLISSSRTLSESSVYVGVFSGIPLFFPFTWLTSWKAGNYVCEEILSAFIRLVMPTPELQHYTVSTLFLALKEGVTQKSLTLAAVWLIGEPSSILMGQGVHNGDSRRSLWVSFFCIWFWWSALQVTDTERRLIRVGSQHTLCQHYFSPISSSPPSTNSLADHERRKFPAKGSRRTSGEGLQPKPRVGDLTACSGAFYSP